MIQAGFSNVAGFCNRVGSISIYSTFNFDFASICTMEDPRTVKTKYFNPLDEGEIIREALSNQLYIPLFNI